MLCRFFFFFCGWFWSNQSIKSNLIISSSGRKYSLKMIGLYKNCDSIFFFNFKALLLTGEAPRTNRCAGRRLGCPSRRDNPHSLTAAAAGSFPSISRAFRVPSGPGCYHQHHHHHHHPPASSTAVSPPPPPLQDASSLPRPPLASQPRRCALWPGSHDGSFLGGFTSPCLLNY